MESSMDSIVEYPPRNEKSNGGTDGAGKRDDNSPYRETKYSTTQNREKYDGGQRQGRCHNVERAKGDNHLNGMISVELLQEDLL